MSILARRSRPPALPPDRVGEYEITATSAGLPHHTWEGRWLRAGDRLILSNIQSVEFYGDTIGLWLYGAEAVRTWAAGMVQSGWEDVTVWRNVDGRRERVGSYEDVR